MRWNWFERGHKASIEWTGFIEQTVRMEGKLEVSGTFRVDGHIKGTILSEHCLILGENARVEGQVDGNQVRIAGRFEGFIFAKGSVEILPGGIVTGEIQTPCLVIGSGGVFDGQCHMLAVAPAVKGVTIPIRSASRG